MELVPLIAAAQQATITTNLNQFFGSLMTLGASVVGGWAGVHTAIGGFQIAGAHGNALKAEHGMDAIKHAAWGAGVGLVAGAVGLMLKGIIPATPFS